MVRYQYLCVHKLCERIFPYLFALHLKTLQQSVCLPKKYATAKASEMSPSNDFIKEYPYLPKSDDSGKAFCTLCMTTFLVENSGRSQITAHSESNKHKLAIAARSKSKSTTQIVRNKDSSYNKTELDLALQMSSSAFHTIRHNQSFRSINCTSSKHRQFFEPKFSCSHTNVTLLLKDRRDGVVVRASASKSVDLGFIPLVESYQKTLKNGIYSFPAWRSAFMGGCGEQAGEFACCVLGQGT